MSVISGSNYIWVFFLTEHDFTLHKLLIRVKVTKRSSSLITIKNSKLNMQYKNYSLKNLTQI